MTNIEIADRSDDTTTELEIVSLGGVSKVKVGKSKDRARLKARVYDLKDAADLAVIAKDLSSFFEQVQSSPEAKAHPEDVKALSQAARLASAGNGEGAKKRLKGVGKWLLQTVTAIGTPLAVEFLKHSI